MRVRVKFRYRADTGQVEMFEVDDLQAGPREADHDARHDRAAADVARVVERNALIEEAASGAEFSEIVVTHAEQEEPARQPERDRRADG